MLSLKIRFRRLSAERLTANHNQYVYMYRISTCITKFMYIHTLLQKHNDILGMLECRSPVYGNPQEHALNT